MADELKLLTEEDIAKLPHWARVAFAARCARRVQPLFHHFWPDAPAHHIQAIENAIAFAERAARVAAGARARAANAANAANVPYSAAYSAYSAHAAAAAAAYDAAHSAAHAAHAATCTARAANYAVKIDNFIIQDFNTILLLAQQNRWTDYTTVPTSVFGPMWPNGVPEGWPVEKSNEVASLTEPVAVDPAIPHIRGLIVSLYSNPDTPPEVIEEGLVRIYQAANNYHMARGAGVLSVSKFRRMVNACVLEPAGS